MSLILVATPGAVNANAYCTVAEADAYHAIRLFSSAWDTDTDTKIQAIIWATKLLDAQYEWLQWPATTTQALQWPRTGLLKRSRLAFVLNTDIPQELKDATAEYARQLIAGDRTADSDVETQGLKELVAGPVRMFFKDNVAPKVVPDAVRNLMPPWWGTARGAAGSVFLGRS
jgi:hypothetical protein